MSWRTISGLAGLAAAVAMTVPACKNEQGAGAWAIARRTESGSIKLPKLGLQIDAPGRVEIGNAELGEGHALRSETIGTIYVTMIERPESLAEAKSAAKEILAPENMTAEQLPDGWALSFGVSGGGKTSYAVEVQRTIEGKAYSCKSTASDSGRESAALAACKSLRR